MSYPTVTFADTVKQLLYRAGLESDNPNPALFADLAALTNLRLRECWEYTEWDFLKQIDSVTAAPNGNSGVRSLNISDGRRVLGVWHEDPREAEMPSAIRFDVVEGGSLRLQNGAPMTVFFQYIADTPDWSLAAASVLPRNFQAPAVELAFADYLQQDSQFARAGLAEARGYLLLNQLCLKLARSNTQPRVSVRRSIPSAGPYRGRNY